MEVEENNRLLAILCSLIGGLIGCIPWILAYVYGNMIVALLAVFIAMAAWKAYNLAHGKVDKYVPAIIVIVSIISVTIATFVIIPALLLFKEGHSFSFSAIKELYEYGTFTSGITRDYLVSLLFTVLGISGVITNMNNQIRTGKKVNLMDYTNISDEEKDVVHKAFLKLGAFDKYSAIEQKTILDNIEDDNKEILFMKFISNGIIKSYKKKYYYSEEVAMNPGKANLKRTFKIVGWVILALILISVIAAVFGSNTDTSSAKKTTDTQSNDIEYNEVRQDNKISYLVPSDWVEVEKYRKDNIYYYTPSIDKTGYSGIISVRYGDVDYSTNEFDEFKKTIKGVIDEDDDPALISLNTNEFKTELGYNVFEIVAEYKDDTYPTTEYMYYILGDKTYGLVYLTDYYSKYVKEPKKTAYAMVNQFKFIRGENYE